MGGGGENPSPRFPLREHRHPAGFISPGDGSRLRLSGLLNGACAEPNALPFEAPMISALLGAIALSPLLSVPLQGSWSIARSALHTKEWLEPNEYGRVQVSTSLWLLERHAMIPHTFLALQ